MRDDASIARKVLDFWFGSPGSAERGRPRVEWFGKDPAFDREIRERFGDWVGRGMSGDLDGLARDRDGALALTLMLDQFTRNIFRDTPRAFAGDALALAMARKAVAEGWDRFGTSTERVFFYLPFEHSEDLAVQEEGLPLFESLEDPESLKWARAHHDVIVRFGRFPHRNAILGREDTPEEAEFLTRPGSRF